MKKVTRNEADFDELFYYAKEHFGLEWNPCDTIFFREDIIPYKGYKDFELNDLWAEFSDNGERHYRSPERLKAYEILIHFMKSNNVEELRVYGG